MRLKLVILDQTQNWRDDIVALAGGQIFQTYLFDADEQTYCCELTPSYELHPLYSTPVKYIKDDVAREALFDDLMMGDCQDEPVEYHQCQWIDKLPAERFYECDMTSIDAERADYPSEKEWHDAVMEEYREYYNANWHHQLPASVIEEDATPYPDPSVS